MVKIDNKIPDVNSNSNDVTGEETTKRYQINPDELTFPIDGIKNAKVVNNEPSSNIKSVGEKKEVPIDPRIVEFERLDKLKYVDKGLKFIHLPDDPAYEPLSLDAIKMNEFENDRDLTLKTRIMMNVALSDYAIFRLLNDDGDIVDNTKVFFRRVKTNEFQDYIDLQAELDDLVKRVGIIETTIPFTIELQDKLYEYQKRLISVARQRVRKGFDIFFKLSKEERDLYNDFDTNDVGFNVDSAFLRITKSPFLRRKSSLSS